MVYTAALAMVLFYAANVPLCIAFFLQTEEGLQFGVGISAFDGSIAMNHARKSPQKNKPKAGTHLPSIRFAVKAVIELLRHIRFRRFHLRIGTGDAALTALLCGAVVTLARVFEKSDIVPVFDKPHLELSGIIEIRAGNIIRAIALAGAQSVRRSIQMKG